MIVNLIYIFLVIAFALLAIKNTTSYELLKLLSSLVSLFMAVLLNSSIAVLLTNIDFIRIDENTSIVLGTEVIYYKVVAFFAVFLVTNLLVTTIIKVFSIDKKITFKSSRWKTIALGFLNGYIYSTLLLTLFLSSPYALEYANNLSYILSDYSIVGFATDTALYNYKEVYEVMEANPGLTGDEINIVVLDSLVTSGYASKAELYRILENSNWINEVVIKWLQG